MQIERKSITVKLPTTELRALIVIEAEGQRYASVSDEVQATVYINLPASAEDNRLIPAIEFGHRVKLIDSDLIGIWGQLDDEYDGLKDTPLRYKSRTFYAEKWSVVLAEAEAFGMAEVAKLVDALNTRKQALSDAEVD